MENRNRPARPRFFIGAAAAIIAAVEGALLLSRKALAANVVGLSKEVMDLLTAIAQGIGSTLEKLEDILGAIESIPGGIGGQGYPPNTNNMEALFVGCPWAQPKSYRLPSLAVPDGMQLQIKGAPTNWGVVYVARSEVKAGQPTLAWPLLPNEAIGYAVKNADALWIGAVLAPPIIAAQDGVFITVEQA